MQKKRKTKPKQQIKEKPRTLSFPLFPEMARNFLALGYIVKLTVCFRDFWWTYLAFHWGLPEMEFCDLKEQFYFWEFLAHWKLAGGRPWVVWRPVDTLEEK